MVKTSFEFGVCEMEDDVLLHDQEFFIFVDDRHSPGIVEKSTGALRSSDRNRASAE